MRFISKLHIVTKKWVLVLIFLLFVCMYLTAYLLVFEGNLLHIEWLVAKNGVMWSGYVGNESVKEWLINHYHLEPDNIKINTNIKIYSDALVFSPNAIYAIIGLVALTITTLFILKITKVINYDTFIFVLTLLTTYLVFVFSELIPHWDKNVSVSRGILVLLICVVACICSFLVYNYIFNLIMLKSKNSSVIANDLISEQEENNESTSYIKKSLKKRRDDEVIEI